MESHRQGKASFEAVGSLRSAGEGWGLGPWWHLEWEMDGLSPKILPDQNLQIRFLGCDLMLHLFLDPPFFLDLKFCWISTSGFEAVPKLESDISSVAWPNQRRYTLNYIDIVDIYMDRYGNTPNK